MGAYKIAVVTAICIVTCRQGRKTLNVVGGAGGGVGGGGGNNKRINKERRAGGSASRLAAAMLLAPCLMRSSTGTNTHTHADPRIHAPTYTHTCTY